MAPKTTDIRFTALGIVSALLFAAAPVDAQDAPQALPAPAEPPALPAPVESAPQPQPPSDHRATAFGTRKESMPARPRPPGPRHLSAVDLGFAVGASPDNFALDPAISGRYSWMWEQRGYREGRFSSWLFNGRTDVFTLLTKSFIEVASQATASDPLPDGGYLEVAQADALTNIAGTAGNWFLLGASGYFRFATVPVRECYPDFDVNTGEELPCRENRYRRETGYLGAGPTAGWAMWGERWDLFGALRVALVASDVPAFSQEVEVVSRIQVYRAFGLFARAHGILVEHLEPASIYVDQASVVPLGSIEVGASLGTWH